MSDDRRQRDLDLLRRSQKALEDEQRRRAAGEIPPEPPRASGTPGAPSGDDGNVRMYRGKPIRSGSSGTPGSGSGGAKAKQFRGKSTERSQKAPDLKVVLERLNELYKDGLITKSEYDRKRLQILDRL